MRQKLVLLSIFAISMACMEAAVVVYLRELLYSENIHQLFPFKEINASDYFIELGREAATVLMILSVTLLAIKKNFIRKFAAFVFIFGMWDLFYYVWLKLMIGWPVSWLEWDILFLIPFPWFGPWICPALISLLFVIWGVYVIQSKKEYAAPNKSTTTLFILGNLLILLSFFQPVITVAVHSGMEGVMNYRPGNFLWILFFAGYVLMVVSLVLTLKIRSIENILSGKLENK